MRWFVGGFSRDDPHLNIERWIHDEYALESIVTDTRNIQPFYGSVAVVNESAPSICTQDHIVIIGDIAIFNKHELIRRYHLDSKYISDDLSCEELIIELYSRHGAGFLAQLVGEFSFVLYDRLAQKVFLIRDQIGIKTLFWCRYGGNLYFSSDLFLLRHVADMTSLREEYFMHFVDQNGVYDDSLTPYVGVYRVPASCYIELTEHTTDTIRYWDLGDVHDFIQYKDESEYFEHFKHLLRESVKDRLVDASFNTVLLSGGLDSTSIFALSQAISEQEQNLKINSVSAIFEELHECDESDSIRGLLDRYNAEGHFVPSDHIPMFSEDYYGVTSFSYEPNVSSLTFNFTYATVREAASRGYHHILTGYGGDHLLTGSLFAARDLMRQRRLREAFSYITSYSMRTNTSAIQNFIHYIVKNDILIHYGISKRSKHYAEMSRRFKRIKLSSQRELYFEIMNAKSYIFIDRVIGGLTGSNIKHPFLDRRLIEYVYKIPPTLRFTKDYSKYILRRSMEEDLPEDIVHRVNKTTHLAYTYKSIRTDWSNLYKQYSNPYFVTKLNMMSADEWRHQLNSWRNGMSVNDKFWALLAIENWYQQYSKIVTG